jgi:hypothetical protein
VSSGLRLELVTQDNVRDACGLKLADNGPELFYQRLGFRPTGELIADETVAELVLAPASPDPSADAGH